MRTSYGHWIVFVTILAAGTGCGPRTTNDAEEAPLEAAPVEFRNAGSTDVRFVGDSACFDCHETEWLGYQEHGMARSFAHVDSAELDVDLPSPVVVDRRTGLRYRVFRRDDGIYQEEVAPGSGVLAANRIVRRVDYVIGSGTAARTFLTSVAGRLYQMPLTWYTQSRRWDFSPGYDVANDRFNRLIPEGCLSCHNDYPTAEPFVTGKYTFLPDGIGCERCHGPGGLHVEERLAVPEPAGDYDDSIVNPALLDLERQLDVCQQCHLHASVAVLRRDRHYFDFRPGQRFKDQVALFAAHGSNDPDEIPVISHAKRMKESECFVATAASDSPMTCSTCHDPHHGFRDRGPEFFSETCIGCHPAESLGPRVTDAGMKARHTTVSDCASCHMPKVEARDAPHASFTDHLIRVVADRSETMPAATQRVVAELEALFEEDDRGGPPAEVYRGMAYVTYGRQHADSSAFDAGIALLREATAVDTTNSEARYLLGWAELTMGRPEEALPSLEVAVRAEPNVPERLNTLALALEATGGSPVVISRLFRRALTIQPDLARVRVNYGRFLQSTGDHEQAVVQYRQALASDPTLEVAAFNLGTVGMDLEAVDEAEEWFRKALELNPLYADALTNLGVLYASRGDTGRAREAFEKAVESEPGNRSALGNLGAFYVNQGDPAAAIPILRRALMRDPEYLDALSNLALAYFRVDDYPNAREVAARAIRVDPDNSLARQVLIAVE